jgi:hypothetical protein
MADVLIPIKDATDTTRNMDGRSLSDGDIRQVIVLGSGVESELTAIAPVSLLYGLRVHEGLAATATLANVASSASSVTLQAANTARRGLRIFNDSTATLRYKYGTTASATSFTGLLMAGESVLIADYNGLVTGIWESANGNARMTELT